MDDVAASEICYTIDKAQVFVWLSKVKKLRMLTMKAKVDTTPPAGIMFNPINPEVLRLWIKSQSIGKENYIWHYIFGSIIVFGLLAMYFFT